MARTVSKVPSERSLVPFGELAARFFREGCPESLLLSYIYGAVRTKKPTFPLALHRPAFP